MSYTSKYQIRNIPNLRTGLNNRYDKSELADTDMADCENIEVDVRSIRNAGGYVAYGAATGPFYGGFHARFEDGTQKLIRQRGTTLEYDNGSGTWTACTHSTISALPCSFAMLNNTIMWSNGTDYVMSSTDGITWTQRTTLPKARVLFNNGMNRILYMAQPAAPSKVEWSDINDPLTVGASAYQFIGKNDGQEIVDAVILPSGAMLLFKTNRFYQISDITLDMVGVDPIGEAPCVRHTAVSTENSAMWAGPDGRIYEFDGSIARCVSDSIAPLNVTSPVTMRAIYHNHRYRLAVPNGSDSYNSYEYVVNRNVPTGNPLSPYVITKNQRYIGCYVKEDREVSGIRRSRVYFGESRAQSMFAYINDEHDQSITQGLNGSAQTCTLTSKFFTEDAAFFLKRYVKWFCQLNSTSAQSVTFSYRYNPYAPWTDVSFSTSADSLDFLFGDGSTGGFSEGYSFASGAASDVFVPLEGADNVRGIQFKLTWSSINDVEILSQGYKFLTKRNFH